MILGLNLGQYCHKQSESVTELGLCVVEMFPELWHVDKNKT